MITPRFSCSQSETSVITSIYCPSIRASEVEINVDDTLLTVHVNPYFLRLNFPGRVLEDDNSSAKYDPGSGYLTVTLTKETRGEEFKDLDLLAKLLAPRPSRDAAQHPVIEVLGSEDADGAEGEEELVKQTNGLSLEQKEILEAAQNDWQLPQTIPEHHLSLHTSLEKPYGFLNTHSGYFRHIEHNENEVNELGKDAEILSPEDRRKRRLEHENSKWDEEHYIADYIEDEYIQDLISWVHPHTRIDPAAFQYTEAENMTILQLPRKEYLATSAQSQNLYLTLLTLLFAYAYDARTTQHDPTPESAWTISSLTPALSALDPPPYDNPGYGSRSQTSNSGPSSRFTAEEIASTLAASYRRSLSFPLYRSWALAERCRTDVAAFLLKGKRVAMRCMLEMKHTLGHHEVYYVYSKIWVDDFCVWLQACASDEVLQELGESAMSIKMEKELIGWDLKELEEAARSALVTEPDSDDESSSGSDSSDDSDV